MRRRFLPALFAVALIPAAAVAVDNDRAHLQEYIHALEPQTGRIALPGGFATLDTPPDLGYLTDKGTNILRQKVMGGFFTLTTLGSVIPTSVPIGSAASWDATISYTSDGHVGDAGADHLDSAALLAQISKDNDEHNAKLDSLGYRDLKTEIVGWASEPHYDMAHHILTWAVEIKPVTGADQINYEGRVFGRLGMLQLETTGDFIQLPMIEGGIKRILTALEFTPSNRYADYNAGTDKKAPYTIADVITGHTVKPAPAH